MSLSVYRRPDGMAIRIKGSFVTYTGYGLHTTYTVRSFARFGYKVEAMGAEKESPFPDLLPFFVNSDAKPARQLVIAPPSEPVSCSDWLFTMYETTRLPAARVANLCKARALIVPCKWNAQCWNAQGIDVPIFVVPLGFNPKIFYPTGYQSDICVFGAAGNTAISCSSRKNLDGVVRAFQAAFPHETDVRLKVKVLPQGPAPIVNDKRISVVKSVLSEEELGDWTRSLTAFVCASRGEAFNFFNVQAMACEIPVIACNFGGVQEYHGQDHGYCVDYDLAAPKGCYDDIGLWAEPRLSSLADQMRSVYENRAQAVEKGRRACKVAEAYQWDKVNRVLESVLQDSGFWEKRLIVHDGSPEDWIRGFYRRAVRKPKKALPDYAEFALSNTPRGLGDTLILTQIPRLGSMQMKPRFIHCNPDEHRHFNALMKLNPFYIPAPDRERVYADILQHEYDIGNGHFIQRLARGMGLEPELKPKAFLDISPSKATGRVALHFEAGGPHSTWQRQHIHARARQLYPENQAIIQEFIHSHPGLRFYQVGREPLPFEGVEDATKMTLEKTIELLRNCEYFVGIISGPMHLATALGVKCVVIINFPPASNIFLPTLVDIDQVESEWFYPQNAHLHQDSDGPLVRRFSRATLEQAFDGKVYPYWSDRFLPLIHERL